MGYLFILSLELVLVAILAITIQCDYKRIKKKCEQAITVAKAWGKDGRKEIR